MIRVESEADSESTALTLEEREAVLAQLKEQQEKLDELQQENPLISAVCRCTRRWQRRTRLDRYSSWSHGEKRT